jgi:hypothetical protein
MSDIDHDKKIQQLVDVLNSLQPIDLENYPELEKAGSRLFGRAIRKQLFESDESFDFLKKRGEYRSLLLKLEKIHNEVGAVHADYVQV